MAQVSIFLLQNIRDWTCCPCGDVPVVTAHLSPSVCCQIQGSWAQLVYLCLLGPNSPTFEVGIEQLWRFPCDTGLHWAQIQYTLIISPWYVCIGKETEVIAMPLHKNAACPQKRHPNRPKPKFAWWIRVSSRLQLATLPASRKLRNYYVKHPSAVAFNCHDAGLQIVGCGARCYNMLPNMLHLVWWSSFMAGIIPEYGDCMAEIRFQQIHPRNQIDLPQAFIITMS